MWSVGEYPQRDWGMAASGNFDVALQFTARLNSNRNWIFNSIDLFGSGLEQVDWKHSNRDYIIDAIVKFEFKKCLRNGQMN